MPFLYGILILYTIGAIGGALFFGLLSENTREAPLHHAALSVSLLLYMLGHSVIRNGAPAWLVLYAKWRPR